MLAQLFVPIGMTLSSKLHEPSHLDGWLSRVPRKVLSHKKPFRTGWFASISILIRGRRNRRGVCLVELRLFPST